MPIVINPVGSTLDASIIDSNFQELDKYMREAVLAGEITLGDLNRWVIRRYSGGRLVQAITRVNEVLTENYPVLESSKGWYDINFRAREIVFGDQNLQKSRSMELLGFPGPSFYWQFQEDGIVGYGGAPNPNRYDPSTCYSYWLTVPGTSLKVYVPEKCTAKIHARAFFMACISAAADYITRVSQAAWDANYRTLGRQIAMRWAIIVDENPVDPFAGSFEFVNSNVNVLNPNSGLQSAGKSWELVSEKNIHTPLWAREDIEGEILLAGGKEYNISLKYRGAGVQGYRVGGADPFIDGVYGYSVAGLPNYADVDQPMAHVMPHEVFWVSSSLSVEFLYGYHQIVTDTSTIADITP